MTEVKPRRGLRRTGDVPKRTGTRTAVNRAIARKLRKNDCDPIVLLARMATDEELPAALRYRAANRLAVLTDAAEARQAAEERSRPEPEPEPVLNIAEFIERAWEKKYAQKRAQAAGEPSTENEEGPATPTE